MCSEPRCQIALLLAVPGSTGHSAMGGTLVSLSIFNLGYLPVAGLLFWIILFGFIFFLKVVRGYSGGHPRTIAAVTERSADILIADLPRQPKQTVWNVYERGGFWMSDHSGLTSTGKIYNTLYISDVGHIQGQFCKKDSRVPGLVYLIQGSCTGGLCKGPAILSVSELRWELELPGCPAKRKKLEYQAH